MSLTFETTVDGLIRHTLQIGRKFHDVIGGDTTGVTIVHVDHLVCCVPIAHAILAKDQATVDPAVMRPTAAVQRSNLEKQENTYFTYLLFLTKKISSFGFGERK